jgi:hypothetical protein
MDRIVNQGTTDVKTGKARRGHAQGSSAAKNKGRETMTPKERRRILEQAREDPPTAHIRYDDWMAAHGRTPEGDRKAICEYLDREEKQNPHLPEYLACLRELRQKVGTWTNHGVIAGTLETLEKFGPMACFSDEQRRRLELK